MKEELNRMTSKERMLIAMCNGQPDGVPVCPDISNMIPCRLTEKPFWDIYLYNDPPLWKAYIDAVKYFSFDGWLTDDKNVNSIFIQMREQIEEVIILKTEERIVTRWYSIDGWGKKKWSPLAKVYYRDNPPTVLNASKLGLASHPKQCWPIEGINQQKTNAELLQEVKEYMGNRGVVGVYVGLPSLGRPGVDRYCIYDYYDHYQEVKSWVEKSEEEILDRLNRILVAPVKPDFILTGGSGLLIFNTPKILRDIALPTLQRITEICKDAGVPTQVHCCGPEKELVKICAEETNLNSINPLEIPPMGDCNLTEIKKFFGKRLSLMGNLHTTEIMLRGSLSDVEKAARKAIDDAAEGGGFILSTGDQCGRDTPDENIFKMIEISRKYGRY